MGDVDLTEEEIDYLQRTPSSSKTAADARDTEASLQSVKSGSDGEGDEDEWLDILGSGALKKKVLSPGTTRSERPDQGDRCLMKWTTMLMDGTHVDGPSEAVVTLGDCDVVQALDMCAPLMMEGERALVEADARFTYGEKGRGSEIPPNTRLQFEVEIKEFLPALDIASMTVEAKVAEGTLKKKRGNELFSFEQFSLAIRAYKKALHWLDNEDERFKIPTPSQDVKDLQVVCYANMAQSYLKLEQLADTLQACEKALVINPDHSKTLYRAAKVYSARGEYAESVKLLQRALANDPGNKAISQDLQLAKSKANQQSEAEKAMYRRMVASSSTTSSSADTNPSEENEAATNKKGYRRWLWAGAAVAVVIAAAASVTLSLR